MSMTSSLTSPRKVRNPRAKLRTEYLGLSDTNSEYQSTNKLYKKSRRVHLNISGTRHTVLWRTLLKIQNTRLSKLVYAETDREIRRLCDDYDKDMNEYFFNRQPQAFLSVLNFYRTGKLHIPNNTCSGMFLEELSYWNIDSLFIETCCLSKFSSGEADSKDDRIQRTVSKTNSTVLDKAAKLEANFEKVWFGKIRKKIWHTMETPDSSSLAKIVVLLSVGFILASTVAMVMNTMEKFTGPDKDENPTLVKVEVFCIGWFTFEYLARFLAYPEKLVFIRNLMNLIDVLSILPFYATKIFVMTDVHEEILKLEEQDQIDVDLDVLFQVSEVESLNSSADVINHHIVHEHININKWTIIRKILAVIRVVRVVRVLKLARHSTGLQSLGYTLKRSVNELSLLFLSLMVAVIIFGSCMFYVESRSGAGGYQFKHMYEAFWWATITITTVGYGDIAPRTLGGKIIGVGCSISGVIIIALPIPIIVSKFSEFYESNKKITEEKRRERKRTTVRKKRQKSGTTSPETLAPRDISSTRKDEVVGD